MALALDSTASVSKTFSAKTSGEIDVSTSGTNRIVVVIVGNEGNASQRNVQSVTASGLTFTKRSSTTQSAGTPTFGNSLEVWWAYAASQLSAKTITVTWDGQIDDGGVGVFAVSGVTNFSNPWDSNASLPKRVTHTGSAASVTTDGVSTSDTDTLVFWVAGVSTSAYPLNANVTPGGSAACYPQIIETGGTNYYKGNSAYAVYSSAQSNLTLGWTTSLSTWVLVADAITDAAAASGHSLPILMNLHRQFRN